MARTGLKEERQGMKGPWIKRVPLLVARRQRPEDDGSKNERKNQEGK